MSFYEQQGWQDPVRQTSWEQPAPPSRSETSSVSQREESSAFAQQFDEIDKAYDNLHKSGKLYPGAPRPQAPPMYGQGPGALGHRPHSGRHSVGDFRPSSRSAANAQSQNFYASQRYQSSRPEGGDQMAQAKRRMAAQRERELRNYHQEQQYNRSLLAEMASNKSDRSMSPSTLSEEGRRELIARQHRALYGPEGFQPGNTPDSEQATQQQRGPSPRLDPFGHEAEGETSPSGPRNSTPPSGDEGHARTISKSTTAPAQGTMGPIGSRPQQQSGQGMTKRTTSPLPSSLGFGYASENERAVSQTSNPQQKDTPAVGVWGTGSGVWGNKIGASGWS